MGKTAEEIGLIVAGVALALTGVGLGEAGIIAMSGAHALLFSSMVGVGVSTALTGVGIALRPSTNPVYTPNIISFDDGPAPRRVVYGQHQAAGVLTYATFPPSQNLSVDSQYLHLIYTLTSHEISSFDAVVIDGVVYNFGTELIYGGGVGDTLWHVFPGSNFFYNDVYWEHLFLEFDFGRPLNTNPPFPGLSSADAGWTSACLQQGCAKVHVVLRADASWPLLYPSGQIPNIQFLITGKKILDARVVTAWLPTAGYVEYNYVLDNFEVIWVQTNPTGVSAGVRPNFEANDTPATVLADGTCSWYSTGLNMPSVMEATSTAPQGNFVNGRLVNDSWTAGVGRIPYQMCEAPIGYLQMATNSGTSGASEPAFATTVGGTTADNTQNWVCLGRSTHAINPANSALCVADYLQDTDAGLSAAATTIDFASVMAAANVCEEQELIIWNSDNTVVYENAYSTNGMFDHSSTRGNVLTSLCGAMAGWCVPPGDLWHVFAGSFQSPTVALGDSDMRGPVKGDFRLSKREVANSVKGRFIPAFIPPNPAGVVNMSNLPGTWKAQSFPAYQANGMAGKPDYLNTEDGGQIVWLDLQLDFTTSLWTAQRLAKIAMMRTRFQQTFTLAVKSTGLQIEPGDNFSWSHARWNILAQVFEAQQASTVWDASGSYGADDAGPIVGSDIVARQTDPSIYEFQGPTSASDFGEFSPYGITGVMSGTE